MNLDGYFFGDYDYLEVIRNEKPIFKSFSEE